MALGVGEGGEQNAPLARAVIGGLLFATFATLVFVPTMYRLSAAAGRPLEPKASLRKGFHLQPPHETAPTAGDGAAHGNGRTVPTRWILQEPGDGWGLSLSSSRRVLLVAFLVVHHIARAMRALLRKRRGKWRRAAVRCRRQGSECDGVPALDAAWRNSGVVHEHDLCAGQRLRRQMVSSTSAIRCRRRKFSPASTLPISMHNSWLRKRK